MVDNSPRLYGNEWEIWVKKLLLRHYGSGDFQVVPDNDRGDAGIEGFAISKAYAYQAYGPEGEPLTTQERYEKQRDKLTRDIGKFIKNRDKLKQLFNGLSITRWILLVPICDSKEIVIHAARKTDDVKQAKLPYVATDFRVVVEDETSFCIEKDELLNARESYINIQPVEIQDQFLSEWIDQNDSIIGCIDDKLTRLPTLNSEKARLKMRNDLIKAYLHGQNLIDELRNYPSAYESVLNIVSQKEKYLTLQAYATNDPKNILNNTITSIKESVQQIPGVSGIMVDAIAWEAIADWIIRCPLDFPEAAK